MRSNTPTGVKSKSPFAINRKSQISDTSFTTINKQNTQSTYNNFLSDVCKLSKSRPMIQVQGKLLDVSTIFKPKQSSAYNPPSFHSHHHHYQNPNQSSNLSLSNIHLSNLKKLQSDLARKNSLIESQKQELNVKTNTINRLESQKQSIGNAFAMIQQQTLNVTEMNQKLGIENGRLKREMAERVGELKRKDEEIEELRANLEVYQSLDPRLKELEELQDSLIEENNELKRGRDRYVEDLKVVMKSVKSGARLEVGVLEALLSSLE